MKKILKSIYINENNKKNNNDDKKNDNDDKKNNNEIISVIIFGRVTFDVEKERGGIVSD